MNNSDLRENFITRGSIYEPFSTWQTPSEEPSEVHVFEEHVGFSNSKKNVEAYVSSKMSRSHFPGLGTLR